MNNSHPGAVSPEEMLAYIDGEAPPRVVEHLRSCPDCMAAAREYARVQRRLQVSLQRFDCPSPQRLGDYELDILAPEERTAVAGHVVECPRCTDELRTLRDFLALEIAAPPIGPLERARRLIAALVVPAPGAAHARLRGVADTATQTYRAGDVTISLHTGPGARRGRGGIEGLAWRESGDTEGLAGTSVTCIAEGGETRTTEINDLGNFTFDDVASGTARLEVLLGDHIVVIEGVRIGR